MNLANIFEIQINMDGTVHERIVADCHHSALMLQTLTGRGRDFVLSSLCGCKPSSGQTISCSGSRVKHRFAVHRPGVDTNMVTRWYAVECCPQTYLGVLGAVMGRAINSINALHRKFPSIHPTYIHDDARHGDEPAMSSEYWNWLSQAP